MSQDRFRPEVQLTGSEPTAEALRRAFRAALNGREQSDVETLRVAACEHVRELRARGVSPEAVVVGVKDLMRRSISGQTPTHDSRREAEMLVERVVTWCIAEYYRSEKGEEL